MQAGKLRHRVTIQKRALSQDAYGNRVEAWSDVATVWAQVRTPAGDSRGDAATDREIATATHNVTVRYDAGRTIEPAMRVVWEGRLFDVLSIGEPDNRMRLRVLNCVEVVTSTFN